MTENHFTDPLPPALRLTALSALMLSGAIFGFFYAWVCSTMWGLDAADPRVALGAMQAMNASVRNPVFAPAFFATPIVLAAAAGLAWRARRLSAARLFGLAALIYFVGGLLLTMGINVPLNEALAQHAVPDDIEAAHAIWSPYSSTWQGWNLTRTVFSGISLLLAGCAFLSLHRIQPRA